MFQAAAALQLDRVVWASSETTLGLPFDVPPRYAPVDEDHYPMPASTYALSKVASETIAGQFLARSRLPRSRPVPRERMIVCSYPPSGGG